MQQKCLAAVLTVLLLHPKIMGTRCTIGRGNESLSWILYLTSSTRRLARRLLWLFEFDVDVFQHAGAKHKADGALSSLRTTGEHDEPREDGLPLFAIYAKGDDTSMPINNTNGDRILQLVGHEKNRRYTLNSRETNSKSSNRKILQSWIVASFMLDPSFVSINEALFFKSILPESLAKLLHQPYFERIFCTRHIISLLLDAQASDARTTR